jgi:hypothetical protein
LLGFVVVVLELLDGRSSPFRPQQNLNLKKMERLFDILVYTT